SQNRLDRERIVAHDDRPEALELKRQPFERRPHVWCRIGVAVTGVAAVGANAHDPAARGRGRAQRETPVLVLERHLAFFPLDALNNHSYAPRARWSAVDARPMPANLSQPRAQLEP